MKFIFKLFSVLFNFFFRSARFISVGVITALGLVFLSNSILDPSYGKANINLLILLFTFIPLFLALFVELLAYFNRKSAKRNRLSKEVDHLKLK